MTNAVNPLVDALHDRLGDDLRVVGSHDASSWTLRYMRDDVASDYDERDVDAIADDLRLSTVDDDRQEDIYELGGLRATVRLFEDGMVVHVPVGGHAGYLVSVTADADVTGRDVVALVRSTTE